MTFLELQNDIERTRRLLRKRRQQNNDFVEKTESEKVLELLYKKTLSVANQVVNHYIDLGYFDAQEKISVVFGKSPDTSKVLTKELKQLQTENKKLQAEIDILKTQLADFKNKFKHGGRKGYDRSMAEKVKLARDNGQSWRTLAKNLNISTATAQKLYKACVNNVFFDT